MQTLPIAVRRVSLRLVIVVLVSFVVAGAFYGLSLTPVGQSMSRTRGAPPGRDGAAFARPAAPTASGTDTSVAGSSSTEAPAQIAPSARPAGGGRPASWQRGLPELARNAGVIAVLIAVVALVQLALRRRHRSHGPRVVA
ncbi:MAG: hypothetical protein U0893_02475 [Chloroflexota bacterium]